MISEDPKTAKWLSEEERNYIVSAREAEQAAISGETGKVSLGQIFGSLNIVEIDFEFTLHTRRGFMVLLCGCYHYSRSYIFQHDNDWFPFDHSVFCLHGWFVHLRTSF